VWCDTAYAFAGGQTMSLPEILAEVTVAARDVGRVCVTGGEPLAQPACLPLLSALCDAGHAVSLETSGALDIGQVDARVARVVDIKAPGSGERSESLAEPGPADRQRRAQIRPQRPLRLRMGTPADRRWTTNLPAATLADWLVADRLPVRFQLQLHKILWGNMRSK
jgi:7-carboxy-7-deazaguanine synthase